MDRFASLTPVLAGALAAAAGALLLDRPAGLQAIGAAGPAAAAALVAVPLLVGDDAADVGIRRRA